MGAFLATADVFRRVRLLALDVYSLNNVSILGQNARTSTISGPFSDDLGNSWLSNIGKLLMFLDKDRPFIVADSVGGSQVVSEILGSPAHLPT